MPASACWRSRGWLAWLGLVVAGLASGSALGQTLSLSILMTDSPDPVGVGNKVTYDVTVTAPVGDTLLVTETIPAGAGFVDAESSCSRNPGSRYAVCSTVFGGTAGQNETFCLEVDYPSGRATSCAKPHGDGTLKIVWTMTLTRR